MPPEGAGGPLPSPRSVSSGLDRSGRTLVDDLRTGRVGRPALVVPAAQTALFAGSKECRLAAECRSISSSWPGWKRRASRPRPEADRTTLIRRLTLDLTGLPPTIAEVDAFLADTPARRLRAARRPAAGLATIRRMLGPALARRARYADTNGYEKDRERSIWPYRDWVIRALNRDMPFDRFTIEQIAGDLLPGATSTDRIATGFHRNTMINEEGGIDVEEFRYAAMIDRHEHHRHRLARPHDRLRPVPHPQVRSDHPARVLSAPRFPQQRRRAGNGDPRPGYRLRQRAQDRGQDRTISRQALETRYPRAGTRQPEHQDDCMGEVASPRALAGPPATRLVSKKHATLTVQPDGIGAGHRR